MDGTLFAAGLVLFVLAGLHSVLGERLIFRRLGGGRTVNAQALDLLPQRRWDALWSTWHLISILGVGLAAALVLLGAPGGIEIGLSHVLAATMAVSAVFWAWGTRLKHPAYLGFLLVAILAAL